ncbi:MAG TPA: hypothetical protein VGS07_26665 [Thermoanaerobaculia bacterium]|jgi:hypothetical protein|nr:hypothetical protein [Thermoanaerobaculia bacterium]
MKIPVFVSSPTSLSIEQAASRAVIVKLLSDNGLESRSLGQTDYPTELPLREVLTIARRCSGGVILGFEQIRADAGIKKPGTPKEAAITTPVSFPTPWNQLEAGILFSLRLPLLVFRETNINGGVFDEGVTDVFLHPMPPGKLSTSSKNSLKQVFQNGLPRYAPIITKTNTRIRLEKERMTAAYRSRYMTDTATQSPTNDFYTPPREHPPRPKLTVRIGITGHRLDVIPPKGQDEELRKSIRVVLNKIKTTTEEIFAQQAEANFRTYSAEGLCLRVISPLAEGADRLVAEEAIDLGFKLQTPLPFDREEYMTDFVEPPSKQEFRELLLKAEKIFELDGPTDKNHREEAYEMVGRTVLRQSDILIAIWDPDRPGLTGGTGQIVQEALTLGLPVVWVNPTQSWAASILETVPKLGKPAAPPSLWNFWNLWTTATSGTPATPGVTKDLSLLSKRLNSILQFPASSTGMKAAQRFFDEEQPTWNPWFIFRLFCKLWVWRWKWPSFPVGDYQEAVRDKWKNTGILRLVAINEIGPRIKDPLDNKSQTKIAELSSPLAAERGNSSKEDIDYLKPFAWADGLADFYANKYRSSFIAAYLMGALAIFFAFQSSNHHGSAVFSVIELILIVVILTMTFWGRSQRWHQRWMDYRALAEELRQVQFLSLLGLSASSPKVPPHLEPGDPRNKWFGWYFRAMTREIGLIQCRLDSSYLNSYRQVLDGWIKSQRDYHDGNAADYHKLCKHLQWTTQTLFFATFACCFMHLIIENRFAINGYVLIVDPTYNWLFVLGTIAFPAFGSALGAILHIGEFERVALRSGALKTQLETLDCQLRCIGEAGTSRQLGDLAQSLSDIALTELVDWRFAAIDKDLNLPA